MGKIKLGLADDNKDFSEALSSFFSRQMDMEVSFVAKDGLETIEQIQKKDVDVLILDMIMPHLDGIGVLESLNTMELDHYPKVIMVSAVGQDFVIQRAVSMGAEYFLVKPVNTEVLAKRIRQVMNRETISKTNTVSQMNLRRSS